MDRRMGTCYALNGEFVSSSFVPGMRGMWDDMAVSAKSILPGSTPMSGIPS